MSEILSHLWEQENISPEERLHRYLELVNLMGARAVQLHVDFEDGHE